MKRILTQCFRDKLNEIGRQSKNYGGHGNHATLRDIMQAKVLESSTDIAFTQMLQGQFVIIIHVGSKFKRVETAWDKHIYSLVITFAKDIGVPQLNKVLQEAKAKGEQTTIE